MLNRLCIGFDAVDSQKKLGSNSEEIDPSNASLLAVSSACLGSLLG